VSLSMLKAIRDGGITGGATAMTTLLLIRSGMDAEGAAVAGMVVGGIVARLYRYARVRLPWLAELDPPAEANSLQ
jgi:hypothetical protein